LTQDLTIEKNFKTKNTNLSDKEKALNPVLQNRKPGIFYNGLAAQQVPITSTGETKKRKKKFPAVAQMELPNHYYNTICNLLFSYD